MVDAGSAWPAATWSGQPRPAASPLIASGSPSEQLAGPAASMACDSPSATRRVPVGMI